MTQDSTPGQGFWPLGVTLPTIGDDRHDVIDVRPGLNILVGPNGSGKTRALRAIKTGLIASKRIAANSRKVRYLSAGRSSPLEHYRGSVNGPHHWQTSDAAVGHTSFRDLWWEVESVTGDLLALDRRSDLKLKVEARLQQLFDRSVALSWSQEGLTLRINPMRGGSSYPANHEASGILQLVALLSAIHNDEIGALLIDEPEISLHPQHQAFLLEEMERVAGDPADSSKKLIVFATHSASLLPLRLVTDLPRFAFFNDVTQPPAQISDGEDVLKNRKLAAMLARLSATHRTAIFAQRILLVEGPSDEIIATQLSQRLGCRLLARNAQILPVTGKGEFPEVAKLFALMDKRIGVLADLDALADNNALVNHFSVQLGAEEAATRRGASSLADLDRQLSPSYSR